MRKLGQNKQSSLLVAITIFSLVVHGLLIYTLHDMEISRNSIVRKTFPLFCELSEQDVNNLEKEEFLAEVFQQMQSQPVDNSEMQYDLESLDPNFVGNESGNWGINDFEVTPLESDFTSAEVSFQEMDPLPLDQLLPNALSIVHSVDSIMEDQSEELIDQISQATNLMQKYATCEDAPFEGMVSESDISSGNQAVSAAKKIYGSSFADSQQGTIAGSSDFTLEVYYQKRKKAPGYAFQISLIPKKDVVFKRIKQNLFFIIDRSYSIDKKRYEEAKLAVSKALEMLRPSDTFNILVFDKKVKRLAETNLSPSDHSIEEALEFIETEKHGGLFSSTELYASLNDIIPQSVADTEVNTAVLFSDGDTTLNQKAQREAISKWTGFNQGKVSLFNLTSGKGNNLPLLSLLSHFNKGKLIHTSSFEGQVTALVKLIREIRNPIGKEIIATPIVEGRAQVHILPEKAAMPDLYEGIPFVVFGVTDRLEDFYLFLQGKYYNKWLDIKQKVVFSEAVEVSGGIEKELAQYQAYDQYDRFLYNGDTASVREANRLLALFNLPPAFQ